jgi:MFS family permease
MREFEGMEIPRQSSMFSPFAIRNFRFQWFADLLTSCALEMETVVLGWYILIKTDSVALLTLFASLQYFGTLIAPGFGLAGDRFGHRNVILCMRVAYALFAGLIAVMAFSETLSPVLALVVAGLTGLVRPSDLGLRNVLTSQIVPGEGLMGAISLARITVDSARILGALTGASVVVALGIHWAYAFIVVFYIASAALLLVVRSAAFPYKKRTGVSSFTPFKDFVDALRALKEAPPHLASMILAFLVNLTAYPFTLGLLPYVARDVYHVGQEGLGYITAATGLGAIAGSLLLSRMGRSVRPARMMLIFSIVWHGLVILLASSTGIFTGLIVLTLIGASSMLCLLPLSVLLLSGVHPNLLGRLMGIRMQAVYGLPIGLLVSGPLIEGLGFPVVATLYSGTGIACTLVIIWYWYPHLWPRGVASNQI